ncbi:MAG: replicative DNA helicase [Clostridia bacterium]|nr:replicative DNA helicase [Clostridia bacterium]
MANKQGTTSRSKNTNSSVLQMSFFNVEAERSLLACTLIDENTVDSIVPNLSEEDFYLPAHKVVFSAMKAIVNSNNSLDFVVLADYLDRNAQLDVIGGIDYLTSIATAIPTAANYESYLEIVERESAKRKIAKACNGILTDLKQADDKTKLLADAEKAIYEVGETNRSGELAHIGQAVQDFLTRCDDIYKNKDAFGGLKTGFKRFDKITNGLHKGDLIVLAARPGCGKSSFAMNIVEEVSKNGYTSAVFSLEMPMAQVVQRLMSGVSNVSMSKIVGSEKLVPDDFQKLLVASDAVSKFKVYIDDSSLNTPAKIMSKCRALKMKQGLDLVVVDYLQLMQGDDKAENRQQDISSITRNLKIMAKELQVPIIALSQMNRLFERDKDRKPMLSDLRESGAIEQDADMVLFINKSTDATNENVMETELIIAKHRNGETAEIPMIWVGNLVHFFDGNAPVIPTNVTESNHQQKPQADLNDEARMVTEMALNAPIPDIPPEEEDAEVNY